LGDAGAVAHSGYTGLDSDYDHRVVDHAVLYVDGQVHTNYMENFWAVLKRGLHGTYISVEPFHLFRYLDERVFTFNMRDLTDLGRFTAVLQACAGRRLTYAELTGQR
jgi:ISXO2-like transposase domain